MTKIIFSFMVAAWLLGSWIDQQPDRTHEFTHADAIARANKIEAELAAESERITQTALTECGQNAGYDYFDGWIQCYTHRGHKTKKVRMHVQGKPQ